MLRWIKDWPTLESHCNDWREEGGATAAPLGFILSMEGADPVLQPEQVQEWWDVGLRIIGPAHYGVSPYAHGTGTEGGLFPRGPALLKEMERVGMILDVTHLSDLCFDEALDMLRGPVLASHHNCRALVPDQRQLTDEQIRRLVGRGAVIGTALDAWMLHPGWVRGQTQPEEAGVNLERMVDHIDRVCQLAGNARHAALGTDLDGGFGREQSPHDLDTIADLQRCPSCCAVGASIRRPSRGLPMATGCASSRERGKASVDRAEVLPRRFDRSCDLSSETLSRDERRGLPSARRTHAPCGSSHHRLIFISWSFRISLADAITFSDYSISAGNFMAHVEEPEHPVPAAGDDAPSDGSLLRRFRGGSEEAAVEIYRRYAPPAAALAQAKCAPDLASRLDVEDIVQSVFGSFFRGASRGFTRCRPEKSCGSFSWSLPSTRFGPRARSIELPSATCA